MTDPVATIQLGDCRDIIAELPDCSVDSIVTDPPYELGFMGKAWDGSGIAYDTELWRQCLRVLKPGGHLLAFGGTRTYHRMAVAIEDAGFEIRDSIHWLYGSGFPKSLDVSKAIDKQRDDRAEVEAIVRWLEAQRVASGVTRSQVEEHFATVNIGQALFTITPGSTPRVATWEQWLGLKSLLGFGDEMDAEVWRLNGRKGQPGENWAKRKVTGQHIHGNPIGVYEEKVGGGSGRKARERRDIAATDAAKKWEGFGTALKPAHEPIVVARKPLDGTVAANVLEHGTGALNIDGCRVSGVPRTTHAVGNMVTSKAKSGLLNGKKPHGPISPPAGRWPANIVFTHAADCADECAPSCPVAALDAQSGVLATNKPVKWRRDKTTADERRQRTSYGVPSPDAGEIRDAYGDTGGASRFFTTTEYDPIADTVPFRYVAKPSRAERDAGLDALPEQLGKRTQHNGDDTRGRPSPVNRNTHPTVKPLALMRWLVRLVTPPDGTILEPFAGSGTTMAAAILEGFHVIGCELTADYLPIIEGRIAWARTTRDATPNTLFDPTE